MMDVDGAYRLQIPNRSDWEIELFPGITVVPKKVPNRFWRYMHYLMFGFVWRKINDQAT